MGKVKDILYVNCPGCGQRTRYTGNPYRPFCSERCRNIDLAQWADENYAIPGEPAPDNGDLSDTRE